MSAKGRTALLSWIAVLLSLWFLSACKTEKPEQSEPAATYDSPKQEQEQKPESEPERRESSMKDLTPYGKTILINGVRITEETAAVTLDGKIYFSVAALQQNISGSFASVRDDSLYLRRSRIDESAQIKTENGLYVEFDVLKTYLHINRNKFESNGTIYADTMIPLSICLEGIGYQAESESESCGTVPAAAPDCILADGRGVWKIDGDCYVEDDFGAVYRYKEENIAIR